MKHNIKVNEYLSEFETGFLLAIRHLKDKNENPMYSNNETSSPMIRGYRFAWNLLKKNII